MKLGIYHEKAGTRHAGGIAVYVREIARTLASRHDVRLYTGPGAVVDRLAESSVDVVRTRPAGGGLAAWSERTWPLDRLPASKLLLQAGAMREGRIQEMDEDLDVLFTHQYADDLVLSNLVSIPCVYTYHGLQQVGVGAAARERWSATEWHVANSEWTADEVARTLDSDVDEVVPPGVDTDAFSPSGSLAFELDEPTVLYVGRLVRSKGVFDLLEAIEGLDDATVVLVGRGNTDEIRHEAESLGVSDRVRFLGELPHGALPGVYRAADVFCCPSHYESFGMVNVEAMACGTPVVTTDIPGVREYADHRKNSLLVSPGDVQTIARHLEELLQSPRRRERIARAGVETAHQYSWRKQAKTVERMCESILGTVRP